MSDHDRPSQPSDPGLYGADNPSQPTVPPDVIPPGPTVKRQRSPFGSFFVQALIGGLIGGLLMLAVGPKLLPDRFGRTDAPSGPNEIFTPGGGPGAQAPLPGVGPHGSDAADNSPVVQVVEQVGPAVVGILNKRMVRDPASGVRQARMAATGSGAIFSADGYIITNYHVISDADVVEVVVSDGRVLPAQVVAHDDPYSDLAVLKIDTKDIPYAVFGDSDAVRVGETVVAIGNPQGLEFFRSVTVGVVSGIRTDLLQRLSSGSEQTRIFELLQTDAAINRGNSGGPLVNLRGEVIGINTLKFQGPDIEGMGFAIPSNDVRRIANDLVRLGRVVRPALGVTMVPDETALTRYGVDDGVIVAGTLSGGPAERAGIEAGDVIVSLDGNETGSFLQLLKVLNHLAVGTTVQVQVRRDAGSHTFDVTLGELSGLR